MLFRTEHLDSAAAERRLELDLAREPLDLPTSRHEHRSAALDPAEMAVCDVAQPIEIPPRHGRFLAPAQDLFGLRGDKNPPGQRRSAHDADPLGGNREPLEDLAEEARSLRQRVDSVARPHGEGKRGFRPLAKRREDAGREVGDLVAEVHRRRARPCHRLVEGDLAGRVLGSRVDRNAALAVAGDRLPVPLGPARTALKGGPSGVLVRKPSEGNDRDVFECKEIVHAVGEGGRCRWRRDEGAGRMAAGTVAPYSRTAGGRRWNGPIPIGRARRQARTLRDPDDGPSGLAATAAIHLFSER
jgi:hypothetical protein